MNQVGQAEMKQATNLAYSKVDTKLFVDGLFVPTKGKKRGRLLTEPIQIGNTKVQYQGFEQLGTDDQSVLLSICANLGVDGLIIKPVEPKGQYSRQLSLDMGFEKEKLTGFPNDKKVEMLSKKTTYYNILKQSGYKNLKANNDLKRVLNRLSNVQVRYIGPRYDYRLQLISSVFDNINNEIYVAVNPELAGAILGNQYALVSLYERRRLTTEPAKLLHFWLSGFVRPGCSLGRNGAKINTLCRHVWGPDHDKVKIYTQSKRRAMLIDALEQLNNNMNDLYWGENDGWKIDLNKDIAIIKRPTTLPVMEHVDNLIEESFSKF